VLHEDVYLATSEGEKLPSLKPLRKNKAKLDRISTKRNKSKRGSKSRQKLANQEAKNIRLLLAILKFFTIKMLTNRSKNELF
jgi:putative transposase